MRTSRVSRHRLGNTPFPKPLRAQLVQLWESNVGARQAKKKAQQAVQAAGMQAAGLAGEPAPRGFFTPQGHSFAGM